MLPVAQIELIEKRERFDANGDGWIAEQSDDDADVEDLVYRPGHDGSHRSLYKLTNGDLMIAEHGVEVGELPFEPDSLFNPDCTPLAANNAFGLM